MVDKLDPVPTPDPGPGPNPDPNGFIVWEAGKTDVGVGAKVTHSGKCFVAKNDPGFWETPTQNNWFWEEVTCPVK